MALLIGAVTMIYPFFLMVASSTKSGVDSPDTRLIPPFLKNEQDLYRKYIEGLFNESFQAMQIAYDTESSSFLTVEVPSSVNRKLAEEWETFINSSSLDPYHFTVGFVHCPISRGTLPHRLRAFRGEMIDRFESDIIRMNNEMGLSVLNWSTFRMWPRNNTQRLNKPLHTPMVTAFDLFKAREPLENRTYASVKGFYKTAYLKTQYTKDITVYNKDHSTAYTSWKQVQLSRRVPDGNRSTDQEREDWTVFARKIVSLLWIRADDTAAPAYRRFLQTKYGNIETLNKKYRTTYTSFGDVPVFNKPHKQGLVVSDWDSFIQGWKDPDTGILYEAPIGALRLHCIDFMFQDFLQSEYESIEKLNRDMDTMFASWSEITPPQQSLHYVDFQAKTKWLRLEFIRRNYISVTDYIVLHGRGVLNTVIYCGLAILVTLIVNPLAAYALSRYKPPSAYKILLFLMLTMAFPPMVTQIPVFLMLREFNLLNTFWALILPTLANGYSIFLLKGFFDSLPQELYESAQIDGAGELRIFWQITMSLSKPILAVIALDAFRIAYSNFMMALLICQDKSMWTLMPWLYQLQRTSSEGVIYASLLIAAIPTFLVFAFCQNIIMRGIVVPVEK